MSSLSQSSWFCSLHSTKTFQPTKKSNLFYPANPNFINFKPFKFSSIIVRNSKDELNEPEEESLEESVPDRVKLALERAREYKKSLLLGKNQEISKYPVAKSNGIVSENGGFQQNKTNVEEDEILSEGGDGEKEIPEAVRRAMEKAKEYQKNKGVVGNGRSNAESKNLPDYADGRRKVVPDAVRLATENAEEYDKNKGKLGDDKSNEEIELLRGDGEGGDKEVPEAVRIAMAKAKEYKKNKGNIDSSTMENSKQTGLEGGSASNLGNRSIEPNTVNKGDLKISNIDFVGLNFADKKKSRGLPAGLIPVADPFPIDKLPDVEILVGDSSQFGNVTSSESKTSSQEESTDLYKPKVTTWGVFPRPNNISKTFGGGRTIQPGEELETLEERAAKEARSRELIAAYKRKMGLNMDPKLKAESEKALKDGDSLMDVGRLKEALPYYQIVMDKLPFQTKLHGLAALQWSICQDSLRRTEEARAMYEKLQSHPTADISKKARQFVFSFKAMEMLKVTKSTAPPKNTGYQSYFEAFVEDKVDYTLGSAEEKDDTFNQAALYVVFLASPILLVLLLVAIRGV
ncbi:uncharacterized protein LOC110727093 isoform X1 [Chenopodium quinoa]|uniref:uncharacterized protein LOC110727093 isoform X1 n=1 Tax=Chenopodium quinoa TaxID=63459 RepID=UPI000B77D2EB|nr:uncharacterized protein LOC110727093 isoform X1 [Chenopodium quinoa]